jgi:hypothetical protein
MRYELIIYWSKEDNSFVVEVPELLGAWPTAKRMPKPSQTPKRSLMNGLRPPVRLAARFRSRAESSRMREAVLISITINFQPLIVSEDDG